MTIKTMFACATCLVLIATLANADESDTLIKLDKVWGEAAGPADLEPLLADKILALGTDGVGSKAEMLEAAADDGAPAGPYVAGDYQVRFLSDDIAVMVHSAGGPEPHWSMHVWQKHDGKWQVAATATVPVEE